MSVACCEGLAGSVGGKEELTLTCRCCVAEGESVLQVAASLYSNCWTRRMKRGDFGDRRCGS